MEKTFLRNINIWWASYSKFANFKDFEKIQNPNFIRSEKSHCFSRIQRPICYNLVIKKFFLQKRHFCHQYAEYLHLDIINWQVSVKKRTALSRWFSFHIKKYGRKTIEVFERCGSETKRLLKVFWGKHPHFSFYFCHLQPIDFFYNTTCFMKTKFLFSLSKIVLVYSEGNPSRDCMKFLYNFVHYQRHVLSDSYKTFHA